MAAFKLVHGLHSDKEGKVYYEGDVIHCPEPLDEMFQNKFLRLEGVAARPTKKAVEEKVVEDDEPVLEELELDKTSGDWEPVESEFGEDVTDQFENAFAGGLRVFKSEEGFIVVDSDDETIALHEAPLDLKSAKRFVKKNLKG